MGTTQSSMALWMANNIDGNDDDWDVSMLGFSYFNDVLINCKPFFCRLEPIFLKVQCPVLWPQILLTSDWLRLADCITWSKHFMLPKFRKWMWEPGSSILKVILMKTMRKQLNFVSFCFILVLQTCLFGGQGHWTNTLERLGCSAPTWRDLWPLFHHALGALQKDGFWRTGQVFLLQFVHFTLWLYDSFLLIFDENVFTCHMYAVCFFSFSYCDNECRVLCVVVWWQAVTSWPWRYY